MYTTEAANKANVSFSTIVRDIRRKKLRAVKFMECGRWYITDEWLVDYINLRNPKRCTCSREELLKNGWTAERINGHAKECPMYGEDTLPICPEQ